MAERTPDLREAFGIAVNAKSLTIASNGSRFEPVIGKPGDGASPSCAIIDEYHEHQTDDLVDTMRTGMGARDNPYCLEITTAGSDRSSPCYAKHLEAKKVLEGTLQNDRLFAIIFTIDEGDDWKSDLALVKANPNFGISVAADFLKQSNRAPSTPPASKTRLRRNT
jgi:phage terminase large subunit-like protein